MSRVYTPVSDEMAGYIRSISLREPEPLRRQRLDTDDHPQASMQISPEQGQFLHLLARLTGARRVLEVGVFMGYSSTWVALALPDDGRIIACDVNEEFAARARRTWREAGVASKIDLRLRPALETLDEFLAEGQAGSFDLAFIDADKSSYAVYYEEILARTRPGGLILVDNVLWSGAVIDEKAQDENTRAIRAFNDRVAGDARVDCVMTPISDGLTILRKR